MSRKPPDIEKCLFIRRFSLLRQFLVSNLLEPPMIDMSVLYGGLETPSTPHRYGRSITQIDPPPHQRMAVAKSAAERRPIVVWNLTRTCNLKCVHCYTDSAAQKYSDELSTEQCKAVLDDLAAFKV